MTKEVDALETLIKSEKFLYPPLAVVPLVRGGQGDSASGSGVILS